MTSKLELLQDNLERLPYKQAVYPAAHELATDGVQLDRIHSGLCFEALERPANAGLTQRLECDPYKVEVGGSNPSARTIPLSGKSGLIALVDEQDAPRVLAYKWYPLRNHNLTYAYSKVPGTTKSILLHRLVMDAPDGVFVDHRDRSQTLDCRRSNLRLASPAQNIANRKSSRDGFKGVFRHGNRYRAAIGFQGKRIYLGYFSDEASAALAYDLKAKELYGEFALPNFKFIPLVAAA